MSRTTLKNAKACPFCGESPTWGYGSTKPKTYYVYCENCRCHGPLKLTQRGALEAWSVRHMDSDMERHRAFYQALLQELKDHD